MLGVSYRRGPSLWLQNLVVVSVHCLMRVVADFLIVIGAMVLTGTAGILIVAVGLATARVDPRVFDMLVIVIMAAMVGAAMFTTGILVHLRRSQKN